MNSDAVQQSDTWIGNYQYNVRLTHPQLLINVPSSSKVPNETQRQVLIPPEGIETSLRKASWAADFVTERSGGWFVTLFVRRVCVGGGWTC